MSERVWKVRLPQDNTICFLVFRRFFIFSHLFSVKTFSTVVACSLIVFCLCDLNRDARCGKIQCQGGANRPVIGTNAVSIDTNIPLQAGGRILCRGTHVYLGDDMPDPGLVLAGTKCAEGMMCLNRQCQNVSVFGVHKCSGKCNGRGECNNKKNCHCEAHWAPPFCDRAGFGGSVDSGPMRQAADSSAVAVGALVTLLCLLSAGLIVCLKRKALVRMLCINKKSAIQKLRSVGRKQTPSPPQTQSVFRVSPQHKPASLPLHSRCDKMSHHSSEPLLPPHNFHSLRRLPECPTRCQPVHISHPMPITGLQLHRTLVSHTHSPGRAAGFHTLPRQLPYANIQDHDKPSPPQKPLPADPLIRGHGVGRSTSAAGVRIPGPLAIPIPTVPRPPPAIPLPNRPLPRLPQPFYDHWHMDTTALGEFHQHLNTLVCTMKTLLDQVTTPAETPRRVSQRRGLPPTPWCSASSEKVLVCPRSGTAELFKMYIYCEEETTCCAWHLFYCLTVFCLVLHVENKPTNHVFLF